MRGIGRRKHGRMDHDIGIKGQNFSHGPGGDDSRFGTAGDVAGVTASLGFAIDVHADKQEPVVVQHRTQAGLAHGPGRPLDYPDRFGHHVSLKTFVTSR